MRKQPSAAAGFMLAATLLLTATTAAPARAQPAPAAPPHRQLLREIYKELVEINTTDSSGDNTRAAEAMAARLRAAGLPADDVRVIVPAGNARKGNLVARLRGTGARKPLLLLAHIDVVEARKEDWSEGLDPFKLTERDGYFYGRGTVDDKAMAAIFVANLIRYKQENFRPERDIIVALTADEEGGDFNGVDFLLKEHRALVDAEFGINEGGGGRLKEGRPLFNGLQASEKVYQTFTLEVKNKGGHSSLPVKDNAIYHLAAGLERLARFDFPVNMNEVTRGYFSRMSKFETGQTAADMLVVAGEKNDPVAVERLASQSAYYNALMRTTCVATRLEAGHAENALPQTARATVNCRILPQETAADVQQTLVKVLADERITVTPVAASKPSPPSPLRPEVMRPVESLTAEMWPGTPVIPIMGTGATDSLYFRQNGIPVYGVSGIFTDIADNRSHGRDERLGVKELYDGQDFLYRLVKALSSGPGGASAAHAETQPAAQPQVISHVAPNYPAIARQARASGEVVVEVRIDHAGNVTAASAVSGHPLLRATAMKAARDWKFNPAGDESDARTARLTFAFRILMETKLESDPPPVFTPPYRMEIGYIPQPIYYSTPDSGRAGVYRPAGRVFLASP